MRASQVSSHYCLKIKVADKYYLVSNGPIPCPAEISLYPQQNAHIFIINMCAKS